MSNTKRTRRFLISVLLITILLASIAGLHMYYFNGAQTGINSDPYVGIAFCGNTTAEAQIQIDRSKAYTNLFILDTGRSELSRNETAVIEICDYAVANGLSIIINLGINNFYEDDITNWFWEQSMVDIKQNWTERWGTKFLGVYYNDEPGGIQLDGDWRDFYNTVGENLPDIGHPATDALNEIRLKMLDYINEGIIPENYNAEADFFVNEVIKSESDLGLLALNDADITTFTSDYGLYWFDYLGGYDVLFAELGWNVSLAQQIALVKGAARLQEKEWGAIITWKYYQPPFLDTGDQIYSQMINAYQAGANYIVIFNYAKMGDDSAPAMIDEHYIALERFWKDIHNKKYPDLSTPEGALVLPNNFGWGMRGPNDNIWGFWPFDDKTEQIGTIMCILLAKYGVSLDIVYEDTDYPVEKVNYKQIYLWNSTDF